MPKQLSSIFLVLAAVSLTGCATTHNTPTYSGDLQAVVMDDVAAVKAAGAKAEDFVRKSLSSPMPEWKSEAGASSKDDAKSGAKPTPSGTTTPDGAAVIQDAESSGVEVFAVAPGDTPGESSLTGNPEVPQKLTPSANIE